MKFVIIPLALFFSAFALNAQENNNRSINVGDQLMITEPLGSSYRFIEIPRKNFIIKRGGIPNMKSLDKSIVTVTDISNDENPIITIEKSNGKKFFRIYKTFTAHLNAAIDSGELKPL